MADINLGVGAANSASGGYEIDNSLKFERRNNETLQHTFDSDPTNLKKNTLSIWFKRTEISANQGLYQFGDDASGDHNYIRFTATPNQGFLRCLINGSDVQALLTNQAFTDTSAWYHLVVAWDTTQGTASNRLRLYLNGEEITSFSSDNRSGITQNYDTPNGENGKSVLIGEGVYDMSCYIAETHFVDGQALAPTDFGEYDADSGIWKPKQYTGTYGNNGFYLDFSDAANLGDDASGNGNNFTETNITAADQATDTPTNNFTILNTLHRVPDTTIKEGNTATVKTNNGWRTIVSTLGVSSGKWYFELSAGSEYTMIGVAGDSVYGGGGTWEYYLGSLTGSLGYYGNSATYFQDGSDKSPTNVSSFVADDIIGMALDVDNGKVYFHKNGTYQNQGNPNNGTNGYTLTGIAPYFLGLSTYQQSDQCEVNYGGYHVYSVSSGNSDANGYGNFEYAPPSGYYALCTKNLAEYG